MDGAKFSNPAEVLEDRELVDLVWNSAAALSPREYSLLDLQLRKGLSNEEMAQSLGVPRSNIYVMLSRLRDSLEESVTVALLARRGRADCAELDAILGPQSGSGVRPDLRRAVRRHIAECPACQQSRRRYLAAAEIFSGLALFPVDQDMAAAVWFRISALSGAGAAIFAAFHWGLQQAGSLWPRLRWPALGMGATGAAVASLVIVALIFSGGGNSEPETAAALLAATGRPAVAHSPSVSAAPAPTPTEAPTEVPTSAPVVAGVVKAPAQAPAPHRTLPPPVAAPTPNATPGLQPITINIRLGNSPNGVNLTSSQTLAAVVLDTDSFSAGSVYIATVRLGGAPVARSQPRDTNGDGRIDLLLYFDVGQTSIPADSPWVCLSGSTISGQRFAGCDTITMLGSP